jgi:hypothetical protein
LKNIKTHTFDQETRQFTVVYYLSEKTIDEIYETVESVGNFKIKNWTQLEKD